MVTPSTRNRWLPVVEQKRQVPSPHHREHIVQRTLRSMLDPRSKWPPGYPHPDAFSGRPKPFRHFLGAPLDALNINQVARSPVRAAEGGLHGRRHRGASHDGRLRMDERDIDGADAAEPGRHVFSPTVALLDDAAAVAVRFDTNSNAPAPGRKSFRP